MLLWCVRVSPNLTLLVKSWPSNFQEHRTALPHTVTSVSLASQCRMQGHFSERF